MSIRFNILTSKTVSSLNVQLSLYHIKKRRKVISFWLKNMANNNPLKLIFKGNTTFLKCTQLKSFIQSHTRHIQCHVSDSVIWPLQTCVYFNSHQWPQQTGNCMLPTCIQLLLEQINGILCKIYHYILCHLNNFKHYKWKTVTKYYL